MIIIEPPSSVIWAGQRTIERFDDFHSTTTTRARRQVAVARTFICAIIAVTHRRSGKHSQELSTEREFVRAVSVGEQPVVTNAMEPIRQYVEQKAAHKFAGFKAHDLGLVPAGISVILPAKANVGIVDIKEAAVTDGDAVRVSREIGQDLLGSRERPLCVDHPCGRRSPGKENGDVT